MIKEVYIGEEKIIIDFDGCPFWKVIAVHITIFVMGTLANKRLTVLENSIEEL
tara:strand:- start:331 stop:489 length:159 start_codon:yes stop_codon:yes gene_type:complete